MKATFASTPELEFGYAAACGHAFKDDIGFRNRMIRWQNRPYYRPEHTRVVIANDVVVAGTAIFEMYVRYGDATLKMGGISTVATHPEQQGHGYGRANMEDVVQYMTDDGYDISFLLGIRNYYTKFGYRTALVWAPVELDVTEVDAKMPEGWSVRKIVEADIPVLDELYRKSIGMCDLAVRRTYTNWKWYFSEGRIGGAHDRIILNAEKEVVGYFQLKGRSTRMRVDELVVNDDVKAYEAAVAAMRECSKEFYTRNVEIYTVPDGGFARWALFRGRGRHARFSDYAGGPMLRLFNMDQLFWKINKTLSQRWQNALRSTPNEPVSLRCSLGQVAFVPNGDTLEVKPGEVVGTVVDIPHEALTEMVLGFRPVSEILRDDGVSAPDSAIRVLSTVFPVQIPFIAPIDHI